MASSNFAETAFADLLNGIALVDRHENSPKATIFGSARTPQSHPLARLAADVAARLVQDGWLVITGAGPGIMEAASRGAGRDATIGINIELPFEHGTNPYVDLDRMHVAMTHFFTRKVVMTRSSQAFIALPGGVGTMDEIFEVLTLLYTGKTAPAPVILLDTPQDSFWSSWKTFMEQSIIDEGYLSDGDAVAFRHCQTVEDAVDEVKAFYSNFVSYELVDGTATIRINRALSADQVAVVEQLAPHATCSQDGLTVNFPFEGRSYALVRRIIDAVNAESN
jgi:uncharacterized protein (TIGR00730 family)